MKSQHVFRCNKEFRQVPFQVELHKEMNNPSNLHNFGSVDRYVRKTRGTGGQKVVQYSGPVVRGGIAGFTV